ncbi:inactive hydroxysteroid dehydrogenase-like protein 1 isoform X2 [Leguminivora glycinivorella]|uniref:inactive hydroxysteroid dehydrogenase-like protein 1 isoform X2 n=1 Tax=Leguminivora glycinivorella TaxID=1035111 RepID=UPI00200D2FEC|nr:inactive hydroxysteroid dehydrogenase-like protein 1 isoform X2 [Leguminivora glycinivorella]
MLMTILAIFGAVVLFFSLLNFLWTPLELVSSYLMPFFLPSEVEPLSKRFGPWAAVTGCTDGIGKYYSFELAKRGLNIVLISRNPEKLHAVAKEIVNNVGLNYDCPVELCVAPPSKSWDLIIVNVGAATMLTRAILPYMATRGRGAIVNISSSSELQPMPLMAVYGATKAYLRSFTHAIREEYAPKGIYIQHVAPFFVSTKMNAFSATVMAGGPLVPTPESYAKYAVAMLGRVQNTTGYWMHGVQAFFTQLAPVWFRTKVAGHLNNGFRQEYLLNQKAQ